jgi:uncharacterized membrane protein YfcA
VSIEIILLLIAVGTAAGLLSGLFGVGGGIVIVPSLVYYYSFSKHDHPEFTVQAAIATSLLTIIFTSVSSSYKHLKNNNIDFKVGIIAGFVSSVTVYFVSAVAVNLHGNILKYIIISVLMISAIRLFLEKKKEENAEPENAAVKYNSFYCILIGVLTGTIAAFTGLGGAIFSVPLMHYLLKFPFKKSIGTTTFTVFITAISAVISYYINSPVNVSFSPWSLGIVDFQSALPIVAASIPFAQLGVYIHNRINSYILAKLFAVFILLVCIKMILF